MRKFTLHNLVTACCLSMLFKSEKVNCQIWGNDRCESAVPVQLGQVIPWTTVGATSNQETTDIELTRCNTGEYVATENPGVWFTYASDAARVLLLSTCSLVADFAHRISVYNMEVISGIGDCSQKLCVDTLLVENTSCYDGNSSEMELMTAEGRIYSIFIQNGDNMSGDFELSLSDKTPAPKGDVCMSAIELPNNETLQGATTRASNRAEGTNSEGCILGSPMNPGIFYHIPPVDRRTGISVNVAGEDYPFDIRVYQGNSCENLSCKSTQVTSENLQINHSWMAEKGEDYYLHVSVADFAPGEELTDRFGVLMVQHYEDGSSGEASKAASGFFHSACLGLLSVLYLIV